MYEWLFLNREHIIHLIMTRGYVYAEYNNLCKLQYHYVSKT